MKCRVLERMVGRRERRKREAEENTSIVVPPQVAKEAVGVELGLLLAKCREGGVGLLELLLAVVVAVRQVESALRVQKEM
jgi:hypothetical protein